MQSGLFGHEALEQGDCAWPDTGRSTCETNLSSDTSGIKGSEAWEQKVHPERSNTLLKNH